MNSTLRAPMRVLPTLNADGTRRRIRPKLYRGRWQQRRTIVAWALLALFATIPFVKMNGMPLILLDVPARRFTLFGHTFLPTDGVLLMLLLLTIFVGIIWITALVGRAWCGWACPQTVYLEFVFRPIERLFEGDRNAQMKLDRQGPNLRRILKYGAFALLSVVVANVFLSYFVGVAALGRWLVQSPLEHPAPFLVMAVTSGLVFFDFAYFREQMCTVVCPYARLQSVLLDKRSLIVGYDAARGEPRAKGKPGPGKADCIDCSACVVACPTGIDIRDGLQLECIACAQCVDACDSIMDRIHKPRGLVTFGSQQALEDKLSQKGRSEPAGPAKSRILRPRVVAYPLVLLVLLGALIGVTHSRGTAELTVLRGLGAPFVEDGDGVRNQIRIKIENRASVDHAYTIELLDAPGATLIAPENPLTVPHGRHQTTTLFVIAPKSAFSHGQRQVRFRVSNGKDFQEIASYKLLGPESDGRRTP